MKLYSVVLFAGAAIGLSSCKKFLDHKQNSLQAPLTSIEACQIVLNSPENNGNYPNESEAFADNYYLSDADFTALATDEARNIYLRTPDAQRLKSNQGGWYLPYKTVYNMNVILETLPKIDSGKTAKSRADYNQVKGTALFFRSFCFYQIASLYAKPYDPVTADNDPGIPIRLQSDFVVESERVSVKQTYNQIIGDLQSAVTLLSATSYVPTQPNKAAAYGLLARVYLSMEEYTLAGAAANSALQLYNTLIDYNDAGAVTVAPFNKEDIFHGVMSSSNDLLVYYKLKADSNLIKLYKEGDLRKTVLFSNNGDDTYFFTGNYDPDISQFYNGIATDELYLIRAECYARAGNKELALADLNTLLIKRWSNTAGPYVNLTASDATDALGKVLIERRKELPFRGLRWTDLRRLNKDSRFATPLTRVVNSTAYTLPPNDPRYVLLIPQDVIIYSFLEQNPR